MLFIHLNIWIFVCRFAQYRFPIRESGSKEKASGTEQLRNFLSAPESQVHTADLLTGVLFQFLKFGLIVICGNDFGTFSCKSLGDTMYK